MRTWDAHKINEAIRFFLKDSNTVVDPIEWLNNPSNIVLENEFGDLAIFEYGLPPRTIYSGHYFFKSRGRKALQAAKNFLDELFNTCYNINILLGMVPIEHKAARWLTRQIGFTSYGEDHIANKHYEMFILTKKEFNHE